MRPRGFAALALVLAACSTTSPAGPVSQPGGAAVQAPSPSASRSATAAPPAPSSTAAASPAARAASAGGDLDVVCQGPCWPLTGRPLDGKANERPIAVRFDNAVGAQPQAGINRADVVFDTVIESCVSRLLGVFHSMSASSVGAIRSARLYDLQLLPMFRGVLAHVGAADEVSQMIRDATARGDFVDIDAYKFATYPAYASFYWRVNWKGAPYNEYSSLASLRAAANSAPGGGASVNIPDWGFLPSASHDPSAGGFAQSAEGTSFTFPSAAPLTCPQGQTIQGYYEGYAPTYRYDDSARGYHRSTNGRTTVDETTGAPVLARNVLVLYSDLSVTDIVESSGSWGRSYSIMPRTTGSGRLAVFRDGRRVEGTWSRADASSPFSLKNPAGEQILLSPGQTWVHIVPTYWSVR